MTLIILVACYIVGCSSENRPSIENQDHEINYVEDVWYSMEEAQAKAVEENKKIMIFVYTDWCGFCRRMDREIHSSNEVIDIYNDYYYPVRLNAESDKITTFNGEEFTESQLALAFGVTSYPTTVFIDEAGEPFGSQPGFIEKDTFKEILSFVGTDAYKSQSFQDFQNNSVLSKDSKSP